MEFFTRELARVCDCLTKGVKSGRDDQTIVYSTIHSGAAVPWLEDPDVVVDRVLPVFARSLARRVSVPSSSKHSSHSNLPNLSSDEEMLR